MAFARLTGMVMQTITPDKNRPMFSEEDMKWLLDIIPPFNLSIDSEADSLLLLQSKGGFLNPQYARNYIRRAIGSNHNAPVPHTVKISEIANELDIESAAVLRLLPSHTTRSGWILDDGGILVTRPGYSAIVDDLRIGAMHSVILKDQFCNKHRISERALDRIVSEYNDALQETEAGDMWSFLRKSTSLLRNYLFTHNYTQDLVSILEKRLTSATEPEKILPKTLQGSPPSALIEDIVRGVIRGWKDEKANGNLEVNSGHLVFIPYSYLIVRRDEVVENLKTENLEYVQYKRLMDIDRNLKDPKALISERLAGRAILLPCGAVSTSTLERLTKYATRVLRSHGVVNVEINSDIPIQDLASITLQIASKINDEIPYFTLDTKITPVKDHIVTSAFLTTFEERLLAIASAQASTANFSKSSTSAPKISWPDVLSSAEASYPELSPALIASLLTPSLRHRVTTIFTSESKNRTQQQLETLSALWTESVLMKVHLYEAGYLSLLDEKLRIDIARLTLDQMVESVIPDALKKAEAKELLGGKQMTRSVDQLESELDEIKSTRETNTSIFELFNSLKSALAAFSRRAHLVNSEPSQDLLERHKVGHLQSLANSMYRDNDSPRLFLKLCVIIHGVLGPGIVYATGRFAPRLLKSFEARVKEQEGSKDPLAGEESVERLRYLKDKVRKVQIDEEDRVAIRALGAKWIGNIGALSIPDRKNAEEEGEVKKESTVEAVAIG